MRPITDLNAEKLNKIKLICFDVDGVTIKKGTDIKEIRAGDVTTLTIKTHNLQENMKNKILELKKHFFIAINSGRSSIYLTKVFADILWHNTALISEVGIFTLYSGELIQNEVFDKKTLDKMQKIKVALANLEGKVKDFGAFEPKQFLITLHAFSELPEVYAVMEKYDPEGDFHCIWNGEAFDFLPKSLDKGVALGHLAKTLGIGMEETMAIGNGPNDKHMIDAAGISVTTEKDELAADYYTSGKQDLGAEELIDHLLKMKTA